MLAMDHLLVPFLDILIWVSFKNYSSLIIDKYTFLFFFS